ncbi:helix-turn-helix domain-containing protein [Streptomyces sp. NBC_00879]|uniref:citrate synthase n=1 Tax=Streptomyces sp. NBC_00879 TaxID=2975855 RepID=UPI00386D25DC|nr:helix-turn-helix domain-containing protein [Streptomyces sp. NBC_00879]
MTDHAADGERLTTKEAAARLGVKPETVYAYVSRGQLSSRRDPTGRGSTFDAKEVDALVRRGRREPSSGSDVTQRIRTRITLIDKDRYYFRGVDATELARRYGYEEIADWLWTGTLRPGVRFTSPPETLAAARRAVDALPAHSGSTDRLRVAAIAAAVADPLRFDLDRDAVLGSARMLIPTLVDALPTVGQRHRGEGRIAWRLWSRLTAERPDERSVQALDMALSLLIDHDLAASTLAVRVAASARAHPYAAVSAGLGALEGPLHGAASGLAHRMLAEVLERGSAAPVVADHLRAGRRVPGLGHRLYPGKDPRAEALFGVLAQLPAARPALEAAREVEVTTARHVELHANVDLALAVLSVASGMPAEAGETVFAVARTAGWIAHALEEYEERPLRMRPSGQYDGPRPPRPLP